MDLIIWTTVLPTVPRVCTTSIWERNKKKARQKNNNTHTQATTTELRRNFVHFRVHFQLLPNQRLLGSCVNSSKQCIMRGTTKSNGKYKACLLLHTIQFTYMLQHNWWLWWQNGWYCGLFFHKDFTVISILYSESNMKKRCRIGVNTGAGICSHPRVSSKLRKLSGCKILLLCY